MIVGTLAESSDFTMLLYRSVNSFGLSAGSASCIERACLFNISRDYIFLHNLHVIQNIVPAHQFPMPYCT